MKKGLDYVGVALVFFCHDGQGNFVMARRSQNARDERGRWDIGGGGLEFGKTVEQNLRAEIKEEYDADVKSFEFLGYRDVHRLVDGRPSHWIALDFKVLVDPKQVRLGEPHKFADLKWFNFSTRPADRVIHSQLPIFFRNYDGRLD